LLRKVQERLFKLVQDDVKPATHWLLVCTQSKEALGTISEAAAFVANTRSASSRLAVLPYLMTTPAKADLLSKVIMAAVGLESRTDKIPGFLTAMTRDLGLWEDLKSAPWDADAMNSGALQRVLSLADDLGLNVANLKMRLGAESSKALMVCWLAYLYVFFSYSEFDSLSTIDVSILGSSVKINSFKS
jgi:hypothetical protein